MKRRRSSDEGEVEYEPAKKRRKTETWITTLDTILRKGVWMDLPGIVTECQELMKKGIVNPNTRFTYLDRVGISRCLQSAVTNRSQEEKIERDVCKLTGRYIYRCLLRRNNDEEEESYEERTVPLEWEQLVKKVLVRCHYRSPQQLNELILKRYIRTGKFSHSLSNPCEKISRILTTLLRRKEVQTKILPGGGNENGYRLNQMIEYESEEEEEEEEPQQQQVSPSPRRSRRQALRLRNQQVANSDDPMTSQEEESSNDGTQQHLTETIIAISIPNVGQQQIPPPPPPPPPPPQRQQQQHEPQQRDNEEVEEEVEVREEEEMQEMIPPPLPIPLPQQQQQQQPIRDNVVNPIHQPTPTSFHVPRIRRRRDIGRTVEEISTVQDLIAEETRSLEDEISSVVHRYRAGSIDPNQEKLVYGEHDRRSLVIYIKKLAKTSGIEPDLLEYFYHEIYNVLEKY